MSISFDKALSLHAQALTLRAQRSEVLAGNLANAETPNYLARDMDFRSLLAESQGRGALAATDAGHIQPAGGNAGELMYRVPSQLSIDGNTVDPEQEKAAFAENALHYQATLRLLSGRIKGLMTAIRGE